MQADAVKSKGNPKLKFGSDNKEKVCGDKLCSKIEQEESRGTDSKQNRFSMGGVAQQAASAQAKVKVNTSPQFYTYPKVTNTSNQYPPILTFTPNPPEISSVTNTIHTLNKDAYVQTVLYDKNLVCHAIAIIPTDTFDAEVKLYKCDGAYLKDIGSFSGGSASLPKFWIFDTNGNLFYSHRSQIHKLDANGNSSIFVNRFSRGLAIDSMDNVYVADNGYQIHKYNKNGNFVSTLEIFPENNVPYYVQYSDSFDEGYVGVKANHWFGILDRFPGYHNSLEYKRPNVDCDPNASIKSNDRPTVTTRDDYNFRTNGDLRADQPTNYGIDGNIFGPDPCAIVIFVHGYNNDHHNALQKYDNVYDKLWNMGEQDLARNLIVYSWDSDTGVAFISANYHMGEKIGRSNGHALAAFINAYNQAHPTTKIFLMSHSMGAQVVLSALQKGAVVDRLDMLGPAAETTVLEKNKFGQHLSRVEGGVYVHLNTLDDALESAKKLEVVTNPLGLEGTPDSCNPVHFGTVNINAIAIDSHDRLYATNFFYDGGVVNELDINTGAIIGYPPITPTNCMLTDGNYIPRLSMLTTRGETLLVGNSIAPQIGVYYDITPPIIPDPRNYETFTMQSEPFIPPQAIDYDPNMNPTSIKETSCNTIKSSPLTRTCEYVDANGNKVQYTFQVTYKKLSLSPSLKSDKTK